jgi:hypothetical protein
MAPGRWSMLLLLPLRSRRAASPATRTSKCMFVVCMCVQACVCALSGVCMEVCAVSGSGINGMCSWYPGSSSTDIIRVWAAGISILANLRARCPLRGRRWLIWRNCKCTPLNASHTYHNVLTAGIRCYVYPLLMDGCVCAMNCD